MNKTNDNIQQGKRAYAKAECEIIQIEARHSFLAGSTGTGAVVPGFEWEGEE